MNIYKERLEATKGIFKKQTNKVLDEYKVIVNDENIDKYTDAYKLQVIEGAKADAIQRLNNIKSMYIERANKEIEKPVNIPKAKINSEYDLKVLELKALASDTRDNIAELKETLNANDFDLIKGQLLKNAILEGDKEAIKQIRAIKPIDLEGQKALAIGELNQLANNPNRLVGLDVTTQTIISSKTLDGYLDELANNTANFFE